MRDILDYFPAGKTPRSDQIDLLLKIQADWNNYDVFVANCPTAFGKTEIAYTIGMWQAGETHFLQPQNLLVKQVVDRYTDLCALYRVNLYQCRIPEHAKNRKCACKYIAAKQRVQASAMGVMNYWSYIYNKLYRPVLILDEAHKVVDMLRDMSEIVLPIKNYPFPDRFNPDEPYDRVGDFLDWCVEYLKDTQDLPMQDVMFKLIIKGPEHIVVRTVTHITVEPIDMVTLGGIMWPIEVRKIIMLSATTGQMDVQELDLGRKRVLYLDCPSPIPATSRPLVYSPRFNLSRDCVPHALPLLAAEILKLLDQHPEKGLIHLPYTLAGKLQLILDHPRVSYHSKVDKAERLRDFRDAPPESGAVLVASGLYEGVDLPYDAARWQLIGKVPFPSLGDPAIAAHAAKDPQWYLWSSIKNLLQAYGRIVRAPDDQGITYIYDTSFERVWNQGQKLIPQFVKDAYKKVAR
jgi:hypothetical protein